MVALLVASCSTPGPTATTLNPVLNSPRLAGNTEMSAQIQSGRVRGEFGPFVMLIASLNQENSAQQPTTTTPYIAN